MKHNLEFQDYNHPIMQRPYRCVPHARMFVSEEVEKILDAGFSELAQSEQASAVLMYPKSHGSYRFCVY